MVVDDDEAVRALVRSTLEPEFDVVEAVDGAAALAILAADVPDLVVLDWKMPGRWGSEVLEELRSRHLHLPVIVVTAERHGHNRLLALTLGANAFMTKPFQPQELLAEVERLLGRERR